MILIRNRPKAGFFSNFNAVMNWYWYSMRTEIPIYVLWDGVPGINLFDTFFVQKNCYSPHDFEHNANIQHSVLFTSQMRDALKEDVGDELFNQYNDGWWFCQGKIYTNPNFCRLRQLYNYIYTENLKLRSEVIPHFTIPSNTLGVNNRFINHYFTNDGSMTPFTSLMSVDEYNKKLIDTIECKFETGKYSHVYLASSQKKFHNICLKKFKDKFLSIPMKRLEENLDHFDRGVSLIEEYTNILLDVINLTKCSHLTISPSNVIFATLYMNPTVTYDVFDFLIQTQTG